ncbi:SatD family protein [Demequina phytophila]|uniref:SatD family protein n=1 Tax=Demequina phytophila TaxID=1638981 RepID=UPI0014700C63|nr:SatD family protein [Demequina phytophila]
MTAVIVDIVGSRRLLDRRGAQIGVLEAFMSAEHATRPLVPLGATVGDEFQAVYVDVESAVRVTTLAALLLADDVEFRVGIGIGEVVQIDGDISDGSAWWRAREAIDEAHRRERAGEASVRSWCVGDGERHAFEVCAVLLLRDHILSRMKARERRIAAQVLLGDNQVAIAVREGISQAAVSQSAHRSGAISLREAIGALCARPRGLR